MNGKIIFIKENDRGNKYGFIRGENNVEYYFDNRSFFIENGMEEVSVGDVVEFIPKECSNKKIRAMDINIETTSENNIKYYFPGIVKHIAFNKEKIYEKFLKKDSGENEILDKFSKVFYVSKIGEFKMDKRDSYSYALLGTTKILKRFIRGQHEFLLIFSNFENREWQDRTLKVEREIRRIKEVIDRNPIPNFYILVSNADNFKNIIDDNFKGRPNSAIIPFSFSELLNCKNNCFKKLILSRFNEYYFENNMLGETVAIEEDNLLFGDRGKIADAIVERCRNGGNSGIFGLRRSGKTSVLNASLRRLDKEGIKYIKIESRSELENTKSWRIALYDISRKIRSRLLDVTQNADENYSEYLKRLCLNRTLDQFVENASQSFVEDIKLYCRNEKHFVIAIDEIELITYNTASSKVWKSLEAYSGFWSALRDCGCSLIVCGVNSTINETSSISFLGDSGDNPMYERIVNCSESYSTYLPAFTDEQTKRMINTLGSYSDIAFSNVYSQINKTFGGQPYAIRQFCAYVFENVKDKRNHEEVYEVTKPTIDNYLISFNNSGKGSSLYSTILQHVQSYYKEEYELLKKYAFCIENKATIKNKDKKLVDHLIKYGLIEYDYSTSYITFKIESIRSYICEMTNKDPEDMDNYERRRYIQDNVCNLERKLKKHIHDYYEITGDRQLGKRILSSQIKKKNNVSIDINTCDYDELFNHNLFIFYFSNIKKIITQNWNSLGKIFENNQIDKNRFSVYMDDLNAGRNDADHYDAENLLNYPDDWEISDSVIRKFIFSKEEIEKCLK